MSIPPAPNDLNDIGRVAWAFSKSGRIKIQDKLGSGWTQLNFCLYRIETGDLCSIYPSKEELNDHTQRSNHFVLPEVKQRLKVEASQILKAAKRNNTGGDTNDYRRSNSREHRGNADFDRGSRERIEYRRSGSRDMDDYRRQSSREERYHESNDSHHRYERPPNTSSRNRSGSPYSTRRRSPDTSRERSPRRRSGSPSRSRRSPPYSSHSRHRSGSPEGRRNHPSPSRGDTKWTYRGNKRIIGFGNNRFLSGKPYTKEEKTTFPCENCSAVFKLQNEYREHKELRYLNGGCRPEESTSDTPKPGPSGRASREYNDQPAQGSSWSTEQRRRSEERKVTSDNFQVYDIDDEPPRGAYYRQERGSKRQEKQKSTESGNRASREVPEILIESSPGTPASDNSDIVIVDNTNTDLAGLTITDSTEDEEIEEIRMDSMADDQQSNSRLTQRVPQLPLPDAANTTTQRPPVLPLPSFASTSLPSQGGPSLPKPFSVVESSGPDVVSRISYELPMPHSTRSAFSSLVSPPISSLPELPGTADIMSALEESVNEPLPASTTVHTKNTVKSRVDTSADKDNIRDTISDSEPNSAVDKLDLYLSKKGKKDYLSDKNKTDKLYKNLPAEKDKMEEKSITDKISQKILVRRSQDGSTSELSSLNLYGAENESLQTKMIQEKNKSKNPSKIMNKHTPKRSSNQGIVHAEYNSFETVEKQVEDVPDLTAKEPIVEIRSKIDIDRPDIITTRCTTNRREDSIDAILEQLEKKGDIDIQMEDKSKTETEAKKTDERINLTELKKLQASIPGPSQSNSEIEEKNSIMDQSNSMAYKVNSSPASRDSSSPSSRASSPPPPPSRESSVNSSHSQESDKSSTRSNARSFSRTPSPRSPPEPESSRNDQASSGIPYMSSENPQEKDKDKSEDNEMESLTDNNNIDDFNNDDFNNDDIECSDNETSAIEADSMSSAGPDNDTFEEIEQYNTLEDSNKAIGDAKSPAVTEPKITFDHEGFDPKSGKTFRYHVLERTDYYTRGIAENVDDIEFADSTDTEESDQEDSEYETYKVVYPEREIVVSVDTDMKHCGECGTAFIGAPNFRVDLRDFSDVFYCPCGKIYRFPSLVGKPEGIKSVHGH